MSQPLTLAPYETDPPTRRLRLWALRIPLVLFGALTILAVGYTALEARRTGQLGIGPFIPSLRAALTFGLGWLIAREHPRHLIALLFLVIGYTSAIAVVGDTIARMYETGTMTLSPVALSILLVLGHTLWLPGIFIPLYLLPLYFPSGALLSPRWRWVVGTLFASMVVTVVATAWRPWPWVSYGILEHRPVNGIAGSEPLFDALISLVELLYLPLFALAVGAAILRFRRAEDTEREQMKWPILAVSCMIVLALLMIVVPELAAFNARSDFALTWTMAMLLPLSIAIAILHHGLWDIDIIISRTLIFGALSVLVVLLYAAIVGLFGLLFQSESNPRSGLIAAAIIAVLFQPLRDRLQRAVERLLFGDRDDPAVVFGRLARQVQGAESPTTLLPDLVQEIAAALRLPHVALWLASGQQPAVPVAAWGESRGPTEVIPLTYHQETVGTLVVGQRGPTDPFDPRERELLATIATLAATTARAVQLSDELRRSRHRIVAAREDERRRLRRDLHDGLGPQLASQTLGLEAVDHLMREDPDRAHALIASLISQAEEATRDVRRLVYDLRPPALDDLGLVAALRQRAAHYRIGGLRIDIVVPAPLPVLRAAVESAGYHIAQEAMTNVVRHAGARRCSVRLEIDAGRLVVEIDDDGRGLPASNLEGVGLRAMRERAAEIDGHVTVASPPDGGTRVRAELPLEVGDG